MLWAGDQPEYDSISRRDASTHSAYRHVCACSARAICVSMVFFVLPKSVLATKIEIKTVSGTQWEVLMRPRIAIHWIFIFRIHVECLRARTRAFISKSHQLSFANPKAKMNYWSRTPMHGIHWVSITLIYSPKSFLIFSFSLRSKTLLHSFSSGFAIVRLWHCFK